MMPNEPIFQRERGHYQLSYLVEIRSLSGFSGSPVFVHIPPFSYRPKAHVVHSRPEGPFLLGIDWGHMPFTQKIPDEEGEIQMTSAMTAVVPVWKLSELLDTKKFVKERELADAKFAKIT